MPGHEKLEHNTFAAFADLDASPTKAWIVTHRNDEGMKRYFDLAFGRRPGEELYDLRKDPHQIENLAREDSHAGARERLSGKLMKVLRETGDPRVTGDGRTFETPPFAGSPR